MNIRQAKKIIGYNEHSHINFHRLAHFAKLRPPIMINGRKVYPSWHDIDIIARANHRLSKWFKNK
jgi:hypothetical protein